MEYRTVVDQTCELSGVHEEKSCDVPVRAIDLHMDRRRQRSPLMVAATRQVIGFMVAIPLLLAAYS